MMYGFGGFSGWWLTGMGMMVLFLIAIILLVIWVMRGLSPRQKLSGHDQALETLLQRYAAGEVNAAEYEQARARLEQVPVGLPRLETSGNASKWGLVYEKESILV